MFKNLFNKTDFQLLLDNGAVIIDVRSTSEFAGGSLPGSENIPLPTLAARLNEIKSLDVPIICVCASGMRSRMASGQLKAAGIESYNGGPWTKMIPFIAE